MTPKRLVIVGRRRRWGQRGRFNLDVRVNSEVTGIDRTRQTVAVRDLVSGRE
ncbi:MAG: hypothetical protein RIS76_544 [Verrucomicrobiota bacterium]|jgi:NADPH-dependent 2,4-dienoyl-CoA reductase/sulfur reductase-like enzyme